MTSLFKSTFLLASILIVSGANSSNLESIVESFEKRGTVYCIAMIQENSSLELHSLDKPVYLMEYDQEDLLKMASSICKHNIIKMKNLKKLNMDLLTWNGLFALIIEDENDIEEAIDIFKDINDVALFVKKDDKRFSIYSRSPKNPQKMDLTNFWSNEKFLLDTELYPKDTLADFQGSEIKATSFQFPPFCYKDNPSDEEYQGFETQILRDISNALNFKFQVEPPTDGGLWGEILANGTATGLVGDVKYGKTDIAFADLYLIPERKKHIDYVYPHDNDQICFLVAKPPLNPKWMDLMIPYHKESWLAIVCTVVIVTIAASLMVLFLPNEFEPRDAFFNIIAVFLDESVPFPHRIKSHSLRVLIGILAIMVYILTLSYKGSLNAVLTVTFFPKPIDTLQEVADQPLFVGSFSDTFQKSVEESLDANMQKVSGKYFTHYDFETAFDNATKRVTIMAESQQFLEYNIRKRFTNEYGESSMHMTRECFNSFPVAFSVPINSRYKEVFGGKVMQIIEAGLVNQYFKIEMDKAAKKAQLKNVKADAESLTIHHLNAPFFLLPILLMLSLLTFCFEVGFGKK